MYRFLTLMYMIAWLIFESTQKRYKYFGQYFIYLTNLQVLQITLYFIISFAVLCYAKFSGSIEKRIMQTEAEARWYEKIVFLFQSISFNISLTTCVLFWMMLAPTAKPDYLQSPLNVHEHGITFLLLIIDVFVIRLPCRYLHFIYTILWALLYLVLTLILHATKVDSEVYSFLDWVNNPGLAAGLGVGFAIAAGVVGQAINYGCYSLRLLFHGKNCCSARVENSNETV